ncbi:mPR-typeG-protein-coupled receptor [Pseudomassariella vexata]|uniref:MPR-typeG-protein-coupled receptor n=1 Tax=Pseudomassariella vexata TaxID=1141098 RepID=A0A1Y2DZD5_9PEZI|nr:mPR-typeG-protein-coupled receptor [Pseudomassariella vexata]ORY63985.1 mPR-typeG-protein-coupled receptor [Pseudomassariella vexata]
MPYETETRSPDSGDKEERHFEPFSATRTIHSNHHFCLLSFNELPEWYRDNQFIRHGYRPVSESAKTCLRSWFYVHNELVNIHSHLLPSVAFLLGESYILEPLHRRYSRVTAGDYFVLAFFLLTATACFGLSAAYHTLISHSEKVESIWLRLDFSGIILLILGSFVSGIYVGFWCENLQRNIYWGMIGGLGALSLFVMLHPKFQGSRWRTFRLLTLVCTGLSGFAPIAHGIYMFGFPQMLLQSGLLYYLIEGGLFLLGAVVYATRFPERLKPGKFDLYGSSHQIFHVLVVLATVTHLVGVLSAFDYNYINRQCPSH